MFISEKNKLHILGLGLPLMIFFGERDTEEWAAYCSHVFPKIPHAGESFASSVELPTKATSRYEGDHSNSQ